MSAIAQARANLTPSFLRGERNRRIAGRVAAALLIAFVAILPLFFPLTASFVNTSTIALAYIVMALGLNIVVGFAGLLDLGYVAFYAFGAYSMGWFGSAYFVKEGSEASINLFAGPEAEGQVGIHLNFLLVILAAVIICAIAGILIGLPTLRLRGDYIAIVTLAFGEIIRVIAVNGDALHIGDYKLTQGRQGITPIDRVDLPLVEPFTSLNLRPWFWTALALVALVLFVNFRLRDSRLGRAWIAIREDEVAAASMGVPLVRTKLLAYATGAAFGGMSGAFLGSFNNTVNADQFQLFFANFLIPELSSVPGKFGLDFDLTELNFGIYGFLLVVMMVLRPEGLLPER